jgi:hypothetical protein
MCVWGHLGLFKPSFSVFSTVFSKFQGSQAIFSVFQQFFITIQGSQPHHVFLNSYDQILGQI